MPQRLPPHRCATRFVLMHASHPGNIGAAARAVKVMGFADLVLVQPRRRNLTQHAQARAMASGADDVLAAARVVERLADALDGIEQVWATAMTPRDFGPPVHAPRDALPALAAQGAAVAFVFGGERVGLPNDEVYRCHGCLSIPTAPGYGSLNLAQAVQLVAYEWRVALGGFAVQPRTRPSALADAAQLQATLRHWRDALVALGFLDPHRPRRLLPRLNQLLNRARPRREELHILSGIAQAVLERARGAPVAASAGESPAAYTDRPDGDAKA